MTAALLPWAGGLTPGQYDRVLATVVERQYSAGQTIFRRGEKGSSWCGVAAGVLRLSRDTPRGAIVTFPVVVHGTWFGEDTLLNDDPLPYDVVALSPTRLICVPRPTFLWLLSESVSFSRFVIEQLSARMRRTADQLEVDRLHDPAARVARCIVWMLGAAADSAKSEIRISQEELGRLAGTSRQRVNYAVQRLKQERLLNTDRCRIRVVDLDRLRAFAASS